MSGTCLFEKPDWLVPIAVAAAQQELRPNPTTLRASNQGCLTMKVKDLRKRFRNAPGLPQNGQRLRLTRGQVRSSSEGG